MSTHTTATKTTVSTTTTATTASRTPYFITNNTTQYHYFSTVVPKTLFIIHYISYTFILKGHCLEKFDFFIMVISLFVNAVDIWEKLVL